MIFRPNDAVALARRQLDEMNGSKGSGRRRLGEGRRWRHELSNLPSRPVIIPRTREPLCPPGWGRVSTLFLPRMQQGLYQGMAVPRLHLHIFSAQPGITGHKEPAMGETTAGPHFSPPWTNGMVASPVGPGCGVMTRPLFMLPLRAQERRPLCECDNGRSLRLCAFARLAWRCSLSSAAGTIRRLPASTKFMYPDRSGRDTTYEVQARGQLV